MFEQSTAALLQIYQAIGDEVLWAERVQDWGALYGAMAASVSISDDYMDTMRYVMGFHTMAPATLSSGYQQLLSAPLGDEMTRRYREAFPYGDPLSQQVHRQMQGQVEGVIWSSNERAAQYKGDDARVYEEFFRPIGSCQAVQVWGPCMPQSGILLPNAPEVQMIFALPYEASDERSAAFVHTVRAQQQQIKQTAILHARQLQARAYIAGQEVLMDNWRQGLVLLSANGRSLHANKRARSLLASPWGWQLDCLGRGGLLQSDAPAHLRQAFLQALQGKASAVSLHALANGSQSQADILLLALPMQKPQMAQSWGLAHSHAAVLLVLAERSDGQEMDVGLIADSFDLSASQLALLKALMEGKTPQEFAQARGVKISTVRTQLSQLLSKTGCRRQQDLLALMSKLTGWAKH